MDHKQMGLARKGLILTKCKCFFLWFQFFAKNFLHENFSSKIVWRLRAQKNLMKRSKKKKKTRDELYSLKAL